MWDFKILEMHAEKTAAAKLGGGEVRIKKQHDAGKLTARERISVLLDADSFQELDMLTETRALDFGMEKKRVPGDGVVTGIGTIHGRTVIVTSQDFTVFGGAGGEAYMKKCCNALEKAIAIRAPYINLSDSGGARIEEGICALGGYSRLFYLNTVASGLIPQIAVIMGNCAGGASYSPALCDFVFMVEGTSQMYITGPKVLKTVTGEDVSMEELGGVKVQSHVTGQAHFVFSSDNECLNAVRNFIDYLPQDCESISPSRDAVEPESDANLMDIVPENKRKAYDIKRIIDVVVDKGSFVEVQKDFATNMVIGLARMNGSVVGLVANQPCVLGGAITCDASDKAARFIRFCDCFNIPIITFVDVPAFLPGVEQEHAGILRHGSKLLYAYSEATVPKISVILRKAYGGAYCAMNSKTMSADMVYAWPIAEIVVMGAEGAVEVIYRKQLEQASAPAEERERLVAEYESTFLTPYYAAAHGFIDEVIHPKETRDKLCIALKMLKSKKQERPWKKHGNIPL